MVSKGRQSLLRPVKAVKWTVADMAGFLKDFGKEKLPPEAIVRREIAEILADLDRRTMGH
jgi:hypothetical protein